MNLNTFLLVNNYIHINKTFFIKKIFQIRIRVHRQTAAMQKNTGAYRQRRAGVCIYINSKLCQSAKSLYVRLASGTEIVVVASW